MKRVLLSIWSLCSCFCHSMAPDTQSIVAPFEAAPLGFSRGIAQHDFHIGGDAQHEVKIPKIAHFIWLGGRTPPVAFLENIQDWVEKNPGWAIVLWADVLRSIPFADVQLRRVQDFSFARLADRYFSSDSFREKSELLRYEILWQEGGVCIDHSASCPYSLDYLHQSYELYCCLQSPYKPLIGNKVLRSNGVIGARPYHPAVSKVIDLIDSQWDGSAITPLTAALKDALDKEHSIDMVVLPPAYFFVQEGVQSFFANYLYANAWSKKIRGSSDFEQLIPNFSLTASNGHNKMLIHFFGICAISLIASIMLSVIMLKFKQRYFPKD